MRTLNLSLYRSLAPYPPEDLIRLGGKFDGGYVVSRKALLGSDCLLTFGVNYDLKFEFEFSKFGNLNKPVHLYDKSTVPFALDYIFSRLLLSLKFRSPRPFLEYLKFLIYRRALIKNGSIFYRINVSDSKNHNATTLAQSIQKLDEFKNIFLKVDIEGDEFLILADILKFSKYFTGLVIEFHRASVLWDKICWCVDELKSKGLMLDHFHVNNYGSINPEGLPNVFELSFSRSRREMNREGILKLPIPGLDSPNAPLKSDYEIIF